MAEEMPVMVRLVGAVAVQRHADEAVEDLIIEAMDAGESRVEIARIIGKSREHLRTIRRRVNDRRPHAARLPDS